MSLDKGIDGVFRISGRLIINIASLNASGALGNYTSLQRAHVVYRDENGRVEVTEVPGVITGNMLKHWLAKEMSSLYQQLGGEKICDFCKIGVMYRCEVLGEEKGKKGEKKSKKVIESEKEAISECAIHDAHGFLSTKAPPIRRESVVKASFLIPVEEMIPKISVDAITFNRVVVNEEGKIREEGMMVFKREHTSALYGFAISADLYALGRTWADAFRGGEPAIKSQELELRLKALLRSIAHVLSGDFGACRSRSLPAIKPLQVIAIASKVLAPNLVHGYYKDWIEANAELLANWLETVENAESRVKVYLLGISKDKLGLNKYSGVIEEVRSVYEIAEKSYKFYITQSSKST